MPVGGPGPQQLRDLSLRLRAAGTEGQGLRRELYRAINKAAEPLAGEIRNPGHLMAYMPKRYAAVLAGDLSVTAAKRGGARASVAIVAKGRVHDRQVQRLNVGLLKHPLFGNRKRWFTQTKGMRDGFFTDPVQRAAPGIRRLVEQAVHDVGAKITG